MRDAVVAIDIGGTKTAAAVVDRELRIVQKAEAATPGAAGPDAIIDVAASLAARVIGTTEEQVAAIGVGSAGVVDAGRGVIVSSTDTLAGWAGTALADRLGRALRTSAGDVPVAVQNDVDAHAEGELRAGAAVGSDSLLLVAVGTGVGAALALDGKVLRGHRGVAGEIAHAPIAGAEHLRCPCGRPGHLEAIGSGVGMLRHYRALGGDAGVVDARAIVARAPQDALAQRALEDSARAVGRGIAAAVTLLDPERVVLSGGVVGAGAAWWAPMERSLRAELVDVLADVPLIPSALGDRAPLLGAAATAWAMVAA